MCLNYKTNLMEEYGKVYSRFTTFISKRESDISSP